MNRIYLPSTSASDWQQLLADPDLHWKRGFSARTLAHCWQEAGDAGWPGSVAQALHEAKLQLELLLALPEYQVPLPGGARSSQTDLFALARDRQSGKLTAIAIEGKVSETFGPLVGEWRGGGESGKQRRLRYLCDLLELTDDEALNVVRYQLIHRTASAVIEAKRFDAARAMMIVHSFGTDSAGYDDYAAWARLLGAEPAAGTVSPARAAGSRELWLGWVSGEAR